MHHEDNIIWGYFIKCIMLGILDKYLLYGSKYLPSGNGKKVDKILKLFKYLNIKLWEKHMNKSVLFIPLVTYLITHGSVFS